MKQFLTIFSIVTILSCNTGPDKKHEEAPAIPSFQLIPASEITPGVEVKGNVEEAWKWKDTTGEHVLVLSRIGPYSVAGNENEDAGETTELYAKAYTVSNGTPTLLWQVEVSEKDCPLDLTCTFIPGSTTITDLDSNGVFEIKIQYAKTCRGDVSPSNMGLLMFEGSRRFELNGVRWISIEPGDVFNVTPDNVNLEKLPRKTDEVDQMIQEFGRYETESSFENAPASFLPFARSEWLKYAKENIGVE